MGITTICGINWGDEGKGRMVDYFASSADFVIRFQGGNNAGHTVMNEYGKFALHLLPSGIFNKKAINILGNGTVVNPEALAKEIEEIEKVIGSIDNLLISDRCHIIFPFHILLDEYEEERLKEKKFGSTKRGIAPVYSDKYLKVGILASDLLDKDYLYKRLKNNLEFKNQIIEKVYNKPKVDIDEMLEWGYSNGKKISRYIKDVIPIIHEAVYEDKKILLEGQLGALRDIEFGIYPYTTSSSPIPGYAPAGTSIPPYEIKRVIGVMKAYSTCVGEGPFVTEIFSEKAEEIRKKGNEYGAATGRPRRIGWFDAVASRFGCKITGATEIAITLLDVLSGQESIKICDRYNINGEVIDKFPTTRLLYDAKPEYIEMPGWDEDISKVRNFFDLPKNAQKYILKIEELIGVRIKYISVGPVRDQLIKR
ncbi:MAG TPA: adenylosuccinate synthase [Spirochaetota bacterium]|nr:adenylosuccinate synthase [Spirochaetota bacterium]